MLYWVKVLEEEKDVSRNSLFDDVGASPEISKALYFPPTVSGLTEALKLERAQMGAPGFLVAKWVR